MRLRRKRERKQESQTLENGTVLPLRHPERQIGLQDRGILLHEWEVLNAMEEQTASQWQRQKDLADILWPNSDRNPLSGIKRVPGGHGYPVNTGPTPIQAAQTRGEFGLAVKEAVEDCCPGCGASYWCEDEQCQNCGYTAEDADDDYDEEDMPSYGTAEVPESYSINQQLIDDGLVDH